MLKVILEIILTNKNISMYKAIVLSDNSSIECLSYMDNKMYEIRLMDMNFITTGCTWYQSLAPMFLLHAANEQQYMKHRALIVEGPSWDEFLERLPFNVREHINEEIQFDHDTTRKEPAYSILDKIRKRQYHCILFKLYMSEFLQAFGVEPMYGKDWCIPLHDGNIVACKEDVSIQSCKHPEKGWMIPDTMIHWISLAEYTLVKESVQIPDIPRMYVVNKINTVRY
jgi:hypothetical protein